MGESEGSVRAWMGATTQRARSKGSLLQRWMRVQRQADASPERVSGVLRDGPRTATHPLPCSQGRWRSQVPLAAGQALPPGCAGAGVGAGEAEQGELRGRPPVDRRHRGSRGRGVPGRHRHGVAGGDLPGQPGPAGPYPKAGQAGQDQAAVDPDRERPGGAAGLPAGHRADLRGPVPAHLLRVSAQAQRQGRLAGHLAMAELRVRPRRRRRHRRLLRLHRQTAARGARGASGRRRLRARAHPGVAAGRDHGAGPAVAQPRRGSPGRPDLTRARQHLPP